MAKQPDVQPERTAHHSATRPSAGSRNNTNLQEHSGLASRRRRRDQNIHFCFPLALNSCFFSLALSKLRPQRTIRNFMFAVVPQITMFSLSFFSCLHAFNQALKTKTKKKAQKERACIDFTECVKQTTRVRADGQSGLARPLVTLCSHHVSICLKVIHCFPLIDFGLNMAQLVLIYIPQF
jgi:hypothetical protein